MNVQIALPVAFAISLVGPCSVSAQQVAATCAAPRSDREHRVFYVDPALGNPSNDGSATRPWRTLSEVLDPKSALLSTSSRSGKFREGDTALYPKSPSGPIKPGDVIELLNGDHGNISILGAVNAEFVTIRAKHGHTPLLRSLTVDGASKWAFEGLKIQGTSVEPSLSRKGQALISVGRSDWLGPSDNIIFRANQISSVDDSLGWSEADWINKPFLVGLASNASCTTIFGNRFFNLRNAVGVSAPNTLVEKNYFERLGNDAIDFSTSDIVIRSNVIKDGHNTNSEALHADGIQGWSIKDATNSNVVIDANVIVKTGDPLKSYMQGISLFDGKWDKLTVSNNVVVTNHWNGIALYGVSNALVINNTVVATHPQSQLTWINVTDSKDKRPSSNVVIRNNVAPQLMFKGDHITADHNVVEKKLTVLGHVYSAPGNYQGGNWIKPSIARSFRTLDNVGLVYDLRPISDSFLATNGSNEAAPNLDAARHERKGPTAIGAYAVDAPPGAESEPRQ